MAVTPMAGQLQPFLFQLSHLYLGVSTKRVEFTTNTKAHGRLWALGHTPS